MRGRGRGQACSRREVGYNLRCALPDYCCSASHALDSPHHYLFPSLRLPIITCSHTSTIFCAPTYPGTAAVYSFPLVGRSIVRGEPYLPPPAISLAAPVPGPEPDSDYWNDSILNGHRQNTRHNEYSQERIIVILLSTSARACPSRPYARAQHPRRPHPPRPLRISADRPLSRPSVPKGDLLRVRSVSSTHNHHTRLPLITWSQPWGSSGQRLLCP